MEMGLRREELTVRYQTEDIVTVHDIIRVVKDKGSSGVGLIVFSLPMFDIWYDILLNDDLHSYLKIRSGLLLDHRHLLVNSIFQYEPYLWQDVSYGCRSAFILAAASGSVECARQMIADGVDVTLTDPALGDNIVHAIIEAARAENASEDVNVNNYCALMSKLPFKTRANLLTTQNRQGYRPLELASRYGQFKFAKAIIDTRGVYMTVIGRRGLSTFVQYHLREYGNDCPNDRYLRSPLRYLTHSTTDMLQSITGSKILKSPIMTTWMKRKFKLCLPWIIISYMYRCLIVALVLSFDPIQGADPAKPSNPSPGSSHHRSNLMTQEAYNGVLILIAALSCASALIDILFFIAKYCDSLFRVLHGRDFFAFHDYIAYTGFYQINQFLFSVFCIAGYISGGVAFRTDVAFVFKCLLLPTSIFSMMEPLELISAIGPFIIFMQKMIPTLTKFITVNVILSLTFALFFHDATFNDLGSGFNSTSQIHYSIFLLQQSSLTLGKDPHLTVQYGHIFFYLLCLVLLVIYTTAVMVGEVSTLNKSKWEIYMLRRLHVILYVEERFFRWIAVFIKKRLHTKVPSWMDIRHDIIVVKTKIQGETGVVW
jgi:hypothetical protein